MFRRFGGHMKKPLNKEKAVKLVRKAAKEGNIKFADKDFIEQFKKECDEILVIIRGNTQAWISNQSSIADFFRFPEEIEQESKVISKLKELSGLEIKSSTKLWRIAEAIHNKNYPKLSS